MTEEKTRQHNEGQREAHGLTVDDWVRAALSVAFFAGVGTVVGHYIGRWGEESKRVGHGMSTLLGRWIGGGGSGILAAYTSLKGSLDEKLERETLIEQNSELEMRVKALESHVPVKDVQRAEHGGTVHAPQLEKVV